MLSPRKFLPLLTLLLSLFILPRAHADTIDDFLLTGNGNTITFSLPASPPGNMSMCPTGGPISCLPGSETAFYLSAPVTINGVTTRQALSFRTFRFGGGLTIGTNPDHLLGAQLFDLDAATPTFVLETYRLDSLDFTNSIPAQYVLLVTEENPDAATPEPRSLTLFATGIGLIALTRVRRRSRSV